MGWFIDQLPVRAFSTTALAVAAFACGMPAQAETGRTLRMGYILATDSQLGAGAAAMGEELAKRTAGRPTIEQFPNSTLGSSRAAPWHTAGSPAFQITSGQRSR